MKRIVLMLTLAAGTGAFAAMVPPALEQQARVATDDEWCSQDRGSRDRERYCEVRDVTLPAPAVLEIREVANGSISVTGGGRTDVQLRARVSAEAETADEARTLAQAVTIATADGRVVVTGPREERRRNWSVSFRAETPAAQDVDLSSSNGSITIADVRGRVRAHTSNGSLRLTATSGDVDVETSNGSLTIQLTGSRYEGAGLRATTANGSLRLDVPDGYNARLRASTHNGSISADIPLSVQGRLRDDIDAVLGSGGATIDIRTANGSIRIGRAR